MSRPHLSTRDLILKQPTLHVANTVAMRSRREISFASCNSSRGDTVAMRSRREIAQAAAQRPPHSCARRERADARIPIRDALRLTATSGRSRGPYVGLIGRVTGAARLGLCLFSACETGLPIEFDGQTNLPPYRSLQLHRHARSDWVRAARHRVALVRRGSKGALHTPTSPYTAYRW